jgi:hypothetical protein
MARLLGTFSIIGLVASSTMAHATGELTCTFDGTESTATVKNTNSFQATCEFECLYNTEGNEHINRGKVGLNAGQSWSQRAQANSRITSLKSRKVDC